MIQELVGSQDSVVTTVTRLWAAQPRRCGAIHYMDKKIFSTSKDPDQLWGAPNLQYSGYQGRDPIF
jgi:hypothetical protein